MDFRWNEWNEDHVGRHGIQPEAAEHVVETARTPFPRRIDDDKWLAWGQDMSGQLLQVIFVVDEARSEVFILHARRLTEAERRRYRRRRR